MRVSIDATTNPDNFNTVQTIDSFLKTYSFFATKQGVDSQVAMSTAVKIEATSQDSTVTPPATPPAVSYLSGFFPQSGPAGSWRKRYFSESASTAPPPNFNTDMPLSSPPSPPVSEVSNATDDWPLSIFRRHSISMPGARVFGNGSPFDVQAPLSPAISNTSVNTCESFMPQGVDPRLALRKRSLSMSAAESDTLPAKSSRVSLEKDPMSDLSLHGQFLDF
eukprot:Opistho-2@73904